MSRGTPATLAEEPFIDFSCYSRAAPAVVATSQYSLRAELSLPPYVLVSSEVWREGYTIGAGGVVDSARREVAGGMRNVSAETERGGKVARNG